MFLSYARVSTAEQAADGTTSLAEQVRRNKAVAELRGVGAIDFMSYVDAGVSGTVLLRDRPAGRELLATAREGDYVIANKMDRLFRSASDALNTAELLRKRAVHLILIDFGTEPVTGNGPSRMFFGMLALVAEFERDRIAERVRDGVRAKAARMGHIGGPPPFGYAVEGRGKAAMLVPLEHEQEIVRCARTLRAKGLGLADVTRDLNTRGFRSRTGTPFEITQVKRLCSTRVYGDPVTWR